MPTEKRLELKQNARLLLDRLDAKPDPASIERLSLFQIKNASRRKPREASIQSDQQILVISVLDDEQASDTTDNRTNRTSQRLRLRVRRRQRR